MVLSALSKDKTQNSRKLSMLVLSLVGVALVAAFFLVRAVRTPLEEPSYQIVDQADGYELRLYEPYLVAETETVGDFQSAGSKAFKILAGYIFGKNQGGVKMSMTAPVESSDSAGLSMEMTAPVLSVPTTGPPTSADSGARFRYRFVMQSKYTLESLPKPIDPRIELKEVGVRLVAARRYSGSWGQLAYEKQERDLLLALERDGRTRIGEPQFARYNAPFTPSFLRRNEVLVELNAPNSEPVRAERQDN
jgi:hypothetical protein